MPKRHHYRRRVESTPELDMTTFMNLMPDLPLRLTLFNHCQTTSGELDFALTFSDEWSDQQFRFPINNRVILVLRTRRQLACSTPHTASFTTT